MLDVIKETAILRNFFQNYYRRTRKDDSPMTSWSKHIQPKILNKPRMIYIVARLSKLSCYGTEGYILNPRDG